MSEKTEPAAEPSVGEAVKATQNGNLPIGTVEQILGAPSDVVEETLDIPEWGYAVRVRSFTASQNAHIRKKMYVTNPDGSVETDWTGFDISRFEEAVIEPSFSRNEVMALHAKSGPGFQRVINWIVKKSNVTAQEVRDTEEAFQE